MRRDVHGWELASGPSPSPACELTGDIATAWRLYGNYPGVRFAAVGDRVLAEAVMGGRAIIV